MQLKGANGFPLGSKSKSNMAEFSPNPDSRNKSDVSVNDRNKRILDKEDRILKYRVSINKKRLENGLYTFSDALEFEEIKDSSDLDGEDLINYLIAYDSDDISTMVPVNGNIDNKLISGKIEKKARIKHDLEMLKHNFKESSKYILREVMETVKEANTIVLDNHKPIHKYVQVQALLEPVNVTLDKVIQKQINLILDILKLHPFINFGLFIQDFTDLELFDEYHQYLTDIDLESNESFLSKVSLLKESENFIKTYKEDSTRIPKSFRKLLSEFTFDLTINGEKYTHWNQLIKSENLSVTHFLEFTNVFVKCKLKSTF